MGAGGGGGGCGEGGGGKKVVEQCSAVPFFKAKLESFLFSQYFRHS